MATQAERLPSDVLITNEGSTITTILPTLRSRISWAAVFAGVVIAMILQIAMNMLGMSIGAAVLDPESSDAVGPAFGTITVVWIAASSLISLFVGGAVAGYMSGRIGRNEGMIHGLTVWAVAALISFFMLASAAGTAINGVTNALGEGLSLLGASAEDVVPAVAESIQLQDEVMISIRGEAGAISPASAAVTPSTMTGTGDTDTDTADATTATTNGTTETAVQRSINAPLVLAVGDLLTAEAGSSEADTARQEAITLMTETGMTQEEAAATIDRWETDFRAVAAQASERAEAAAANIADAVAATAGIAFMVLALGALAAGAGGFAGAPKNGMVEAA